MIDLHLHFDGSLPVEHILESARKQQIDLPAWTAEELKPYLEAPADCKSLNEYLERFALPLQILQTKEGLSDAMYALTQELEREGLIYAEIRLAPQQHCQKGLTQEAVVEAVLQGRERAERDFSIRTRVILCCMRSDKNREENLKTLEVAEKFLGKGVAAVDLAGAEAVFATREFEELFRIARERKLPYTIHAGEADGPESVRSALDFGAKRIGHGVRSREDSTLLARIRREGVTLEVCPISNLQTKTVDGIWDHPVISYLRQGIAVTVNTDNMTVSNTTIQKEMELLRNELGMKREEEKQLYLNSVHAAFLPEEEKRRLIHVINEII